MKIKGNYLGERYKKLKHKDRMEYLAINSIYEKRDCLFTHIIFMSMSIKLFLLVILLGFILTIKALTGGTSVGTDLLDTSIRDVLIGFVFWVGIFFVEFSMAFLTIMNERERCKILNEFLLERGL